MIQTLVQLFWRKGKIIEKKLNEVVDLLEGGGEEKRVPEGAAMVETRRRRRELPESPFLGRHEGFWVMVLVSANLVRLEIKCFYFQESLSLAAGISGPLSSV